VLLASIRTLVTRCFVFVVSSDCVVGVVYLFNTVQTLVCTTRHFSGSEYTSC
jgi:hypothetical protein